MNKSLSLFVHLQAFSSREKKSPDHSIFDLQEEEFKEFTVYAQIVN